MCLSTPAEAARSVEHAGGDEKRHALMRTQADGEGAPLIDDAEIRIGEHVHHRGAGGKMLGDDPVGYRMVGEVQGGHLNESIVEPMNHDKQRLVGGSRYVD